MLGQRGRSRRLQRKLSGRPGTFVSVPGEYVSMLHPGEFAARPMAAGNVPTTPAGDGQAPPPTMHYRIAQLWQENGDTRPMPSKGAEAGWLDSGRGVDYLRRGRVEHLDGNGWPEIQGSHSWVRNPYPAQESPRPTSKGHAELTSFVRPFNQRFAHRLNGKHASFSSMTRDYDVFGMLPVQKRRNTYRLEPQPWDSKIVDMAPANEQSADYPNAQYVSPPAYQRAAFRLGG